MRDKFSREEFFDLCWKKSIVWFCKSYIVSYQEFKSICEKYNIPLPPNGYWMKRKYGKEISKPILPKMSNELDIELLIRTKENSKNSKPAEKFSIINDNHKVSDLEVPKRLPKIPDPIIREMLSDNPKTHPIVNNCWDYTKRYNYGRISVNATGKPYKRALCFLNTFIIVMKSRGHYFLFCYERSYIVIEGVEISIRMRERSKRVYEIEKSGYRSSTLEPIGLLSFLAGEFSGKEWQETTNKTLAEKLPLIIKYLEGIAKEKREWHMENEIRLKKEAIEKKKQEEIAMLSLIKQKSELWHEANKLRTFLIEYKKKVNLSDEIKEQISFGLRKVDWLDPLIQKNDELFKDFDPYKLLRSL
ncbi:hypothetical protein [Gillisia sp. JM1]|uniref:hypothetical protein n=1 Tax=Gillisia sp. JM1 TaxID=1283286 RepID=UPI00042833BF|nr:hypothetical protein [Gillisia sp. JM1]